MGMFSKENSKELSYKEFFIKFASGNFSDDEKAKLYAFLENDDEATEELCRFDLPEFISIICANPVLSQKDSVKRYDLVKPLYLSTIDIGMYISSVFSTNYKEVAPLLSRNMLKDIRSHYEVIRRQIEKEAKEKDKLLEPPKAETSSDAKPEGQPSEAKGKKQSKQKKEKNIQRIKELDSWLSILKATWGNVDVIIPFIDEAEKRYSTTRNEKLEALLNSDLLHQHFMDFRRSSQTEMETADLIIRNQELETACRELRAFISSQQRQISNFQEMKTAAEAQLAEDCEKIERLEDDNAELKANCAAYNSILLNLNSQIVNALRKPLSDLERLVFEMRDMRQSPQEIADMLIEPILQLRENFESIPLNSSGFDNLPADYCIEIHPVDATEDWASRTPVHFSDDQHTCKVTPMGDILLRTRGFVFKNNINQTSVIKADVVPYEQYTENDGASLKREEESEIGGDSK